MDGSSESSLGQQTVSINVAVVAQIAQQCESLHMLRAWYEHFETSVREVDRRAAIKAHDLIIDGVIASRQVARELGISLSDVSGLTWQLSPRVDRPSAPL